MVRASGRARRRSSAAAALPAEAEDVLRQLFSVQGSLLSDAQAAVVAARTGCAPEAALAFIQELASQADQWVQHERWRADDGGAGAGAGGAAVEDEAAAAKAALAKAASQREAASRQLRGLLNEPGNGGIQDLSQTGPFVSLLPKLGSSVVRCRAAAAVAASRHAIRSKLVARAGFLTTLEGWLEAAQQAQQYTLLTHVLAALAALPLEAPLLRSAGTLRSAVRHLRACPHGGVAAAAEDLHAQWQGLVASKAGAGAAAAGESPRAAAAGPDRQQQQHAQQQQQQQQEQEQVAGWAPSGGGSAAAAARAALPELVPLGRRDSAAAQAQGARGRHALPAGVWAAHEQRPLSGDDVVRGQQKRRAQAQQEERRVAGSAAAAAPPAQQQEAAAAAAEACDRRKRPRSQSDADAAAEQRQQLLPWLPPPDAEAPDPPVARGEGSEEACQRAAARGPAAAATGAEPAEPPPLTGAELQAAAQQPAILPYWPRDAAEAEEDRQKLVAAGWRPAQS